MLEQCGRRAGADTPARSGRIPAVMSVPESTRASLTFKLADRARERWPRIRQVHTRFKGSYAYIDAELIDGSTLKLCRLRYVGFANSWSFAVWRASHDDYQESWLPNGSAAGTAEQCLDTACGLYLADPTAWT